MLHKDIIIFCHPDCPICNGKDEPDFERMGETIKPDPYLLYPYKEEGETN